MTYTPREVKRLGSSGIQIVWDNGQVHDISSKVLRENCPSADSRAKRGDHSHQEPLTARSSKLKIVESTLDEELDLQEIWAVGNYAIGMKWGDGHHTGIYTFEYLYQLGSQQA